MFKSRGVTLVELMVTLSILAIVAATALPNFNQFLAKMRVDNEISALHRLLLTTRNLAINLGQDVTLCPINDNNVCTTDWRKKIIIFNDINDNQIYEPTLNEKLFRTKDSIKQVDNLEYGYRRNRVKYAPTGRTTGWGSNGTFKYCPERDESLNRGIVVATSGRIYLSQDNNNDGFDENRSGTKIICRN